MKIGTYITAQLQAHGLDQDSEAEQEIRNRVLATLRFSNVTASDSVSPITRGIIDRLCTKLAADTAPAAPQTMAPQTPDFNPGGKYDTALAQGYDPSTGNKVIPVTFNKLKSRVGFYDPTTRTSYPRPVDSQAQTLEV